MTARCRLRCVAAFVLGIGSLVAVPAAAPAAAPKIRAAAVAGKFYPADATKLEAAVHAYLDAALPPRGERPLALVVPHAGYLFSGQIAADGYRQVMGMDYDLVVILGTNHTSAGFHGVSIYDGDGFRTPLGVATVDRKAAAELLAVDRTFGSEESVHETEHSLEVQVPFVQIALPGVPILPVVIGQAEPDLYARFGRALAQVLAKRRALVVASSDLSHYPPHDAADATDRATLIAMAQLDPAGLRAAIQQQMQSGRPALATCACGEAPILAAMEAAKVLGARRGIVVSYANSGDTSAGERGRVVGYGCVLFTAGARSADISALEGGEAADEAAGSHGAAARQKRSSSRAADAGAALRPAEQKALLDFARASIRSFLSTETAPLARGYAAALGRKQGAFVTLKESGQLRGCIGQMDPSGMPLCQLVGNLALQAALNDRRFAPVELEELKEIEIEISLLTPMAKVPGPDALVVGRDGVLMRKEGKSAVFLPEVAVEQGWSRDEWLDQLCQKAGLPAHSWRSGAEFYAFRSVVLRESQVR